jgi:hypothetical protein
MFKHGLRSILLFIFVNCFFIHNDFGNNKQASSDKKIKTTTINSKNEYIYNSPTKNSAKFPEIFKTMDPRVYEEGFLNILFHAGLESIHLIKNKKSFYFDESTPDEIKKNVSPYVQNFSITVAPLKISRGIISSVFLNEKTPRIELSFADFVNFFKFVLNNNNDYQDFINSVEILDLYKGIASKEITLKFQMLLKKVALQYIIQFIINNILYRLGAVDGLSDSLQEQEMLNHKTDLIRQNITFHYALNKLIEQMKMNYPNFLEEAEKNIFLMVTIAVPKGVTNPQALQTLINNIKIGEDDKSYMRYNYNIYNLKQKITGPDYKVENISYDDLTFDSFEKFKKFLDKEDLKNNNPNFFIGEGKNYYYIIPRFNPLNMFKSGTIADKFQDREAAIQQGSTMFAHQYLDDKMMASLKEETGVIQLIMDDKTGKKEYQIMVKDFINILGGFSFDINKMNNKNPSQEFFFYLNKVFQIAFIEALSLYKSRSSEINKPDSAYSDFNKVKIIINSITVNGIDEASSLKTNPITISFAMLVYMILEYLESNMFTFVESIEEINKRLQENDGFQKEFTSLMADLMMKNVLIHYLKNIYVMTLYNLTNNQEPLDKNYINIVETIAINTAYASEYVKRLVETQKAPLSGNIEESRQLVYCLQILCANKEIKDSNMATINETITELGDEKNLNVLRNELISKQIRFKAGAEPYHLYFNQIPVKIQEDYLKFVNVKGGPNFFIGVYNYYDDMRSGVQHILYILPKYDIRNDKKPGYFEQNIRETEMAVIMNKILYPYLQEVFKTNQENPVIINTFFNRNDGETATKTYPQKISTDFKTFVAMLNLENPLDSSTYINLRTDEKSSSVSYLMRNLYLTQDQMVSIFYEKNLEEKKKLIANFLNTNAKSDNPDLLILTKEQVFFLSNIATLEQLKAFNKDLIKKTNSQRKVNIINIMETSNNDGSSNQETNQKR